MNDNKIDVLAVMDAAIMRNAHRGDNIIELAMQKDARTAVFDLIQAAQRACDTWPATASVSGLRSALASAQGRAADCDCPGGDKPAILHAPNCPARVAAND